ncbi:MAG: hypothetical protein IT289_09025 [Oligoflexia bacterium]|nr:hypothetical protein [Oligoflexia bacterium]
MNRHLRLVLQLFVVMSIVGCRSASTIPDEIKNDSPQGDYKSILEEWTNSDKVYSGLKADFIVDATLKTREIIEHQNYKDAVRLSWTPEQFRENRQKSLYEASAETHFFVSLYTETDDINNLDKSSSTWNVFLDVGGRRLQPKQVRRLFDEREVLITHYPYHSIWARPYLIRFEIPTSDVIGTTSTLTIAGPRGASKLFYPRKN